MRAERFRLRFISGVSIPAATYGSGFYGTQTYGQSATDPLASFRYRPVPIPAGWPVDPAWLYRQDDTGPPFLVELLSDAGPLDLTAVATARLVLDGHDSHERYVLPLVTTTVVGELRHEFNVGEMPPEGAYRVAVVLDFVSGRRLTVPYDDRSRFVVASSTHGVPVPPP